MFLVKNLIVGAGISSLVIAERIANIFKEEVVIYEKRGHIGGNIYDCNQEGILIHQYGAHIFHTNEEKVWKYLKQFSDFYPYVHKVRAFVNGSFIPVPFNLNSLKKVFPDSIYKSLENKLIETFGYGNKISILELKKHKDFEFLSEFIYQNIFHHYTLKQWQCQPNELDESVLARVPVVISKDNRYFNDKYQGIPIEGYTKMCENMIKNPLIQVKINTEFNYTQDLKAKRIFYAGGIDDFFENKFGSLPYRSLEFDIKNFNKKYFQQKAVINYPNNYDFTRIIEHKHFLDQKTTSTIVSFEYPKNYEKGREKYYPIPNNDSKDLYLKYSQEARKLSNVYFIGRLGEYKYYDMDKAVLRSLEIFDNLS